MIGDNKLEIVSATNKGIYIISSTGQILNNLHQNTAFSGIDFLHAVLSDLNNDGKLEILAKSLDQYSIDGRKVFAWYGNGNFYPGWPIVFNFNLGFIGEPTIVDFEENGVKTIILPIRSYNSLGPSPEVVAVNTAGIIQWRTPIVGSSRSVPRPQALVGDVDGDGEYDIVVKVEELSSPLMRYHFKILDKHGTIKYQWQLSQYPIFEEISGGAQITLADINNDGKLEIITRDSAYVYVYDYLGTLQPGFPRVIYEGNPRNPTGVCGPTIPQLVPYCKTGDIGVGDLDNDGYLDIYATALNMYRTGQINDHQKGFFALNRFGNAVPGYPFILNNYQQTEGDIYDSSYTPTYTDINNDDMGDIIVSKGWGAIEVFTTNVPYKTKVGLCSYAFSQYGFDLQNTKVVPKCIKPIQPVPTLP